MPTLIDQIFLEKVSSKFELLRPDVVKSIKSFLNEGNTNFEILPPKEINWEIKIGFANLIKYGSIFGILLSLIGTIFIYYKDSKKNKKPLPKISDFNMLNKAKKD